MNKAERNTWPHNNRPSSRHQFKVTFQHSSEFGETCQRCGSHYNTRVGGTASVYCFPTKAWLEAHPEDNGWLGETKTPFG